MSSNQPVDPEDTRRRRTSRRRRLAGWPRWRRRPRWPGWSRWSLRARVLAALVALVAVVCLVIGTVTVLALERFLVGQLDTQLAAAANRTSQAGGSKPPPLTDPPRTPRGLEFLASPGQAAGTLGARVVDGRVTLAAAINENGTVQSIPSTQVTALARLSTGGQPVTLDLGKLGEYRLVATRTPGGDVLVTGLPLSGVRATVWQLVAVWAIVAAAGLLAAGAAGAVIVRIALRPLRRVASTASRVADLPLDRGEVVLHTRVPDTDTDARTEVGQVGAAINRMLGHVAGALAARHASETRVRQFVADASHELRTPLAAIRGYAELTRRVDASQEVIARALYRIEAESARMTTLVDDLLLLARLDAGRPLAREPVDLSRLAVDVVGDAHVAGPDHRWSLDLPDVPLTVLGDDARLHQVVANLLANARTHTPPGTAVTVRLDAAGDHAAIRVSDNGPGIPPALLPDVFERFVRGDTSRSRAAGSTGLGLSIVSAVVTAHGGTVEVESGPGWTAFTVLLPVHSGRTAPPQGSHRSRADARAHDVEPV